MGDAMNERLKELGIQAGGVWIEHATAFLSGTLNLTRFAELVRDDERAKCASDYLQDCCDAVEAARLEEREACVKLLDDFAKTEMVPVKDTWRMGVMAATNAVRDKK